MTTVYHVARNGSDVSDGSVERPFRTINRAAEILQPGDTAMVHEGEYREWVRPRNGGLSPTRRITYQAAPGEHVVIKGSEQVTNWQCLAGSVWKALVQNAMFGSFNPFAEELAGDWLLDPPVGAPKKHLGEVYLNGRSCYEVSTRAEVDDPPLRTYALDQATRVVHPLRDSAQTQHVWFAEVGSDTTTIWANFQGSDPNEHLVEINVRRSVFYPTANHVDYITVRGFELAQAACPWTPPTADQPGLIGPNWAKGWIIEDNVIHDAKCSAISIGKEVSTGHNHATRRGDKPGYQYQVESVFLAGQIGWDKEHIGSHVIRRNTIYDCGQNGIVGHLGCVFSVIEDNHIYNIATKREFYGHEIAAIKLHAPIDVIIRHNRIHHSTLGVWLDWQSQGTRFSQNALYANTRDLFIEVGHGPCLVDYNVLASPVSLELATQGGAFINNVLCGTVRCESVMDRATPYHVPHSTQVAGFGLIYGGDDRYIGNIFIAGDADQAYGEGLESTATAGYGTEEFEDHPGSLGEYMALIEAHSGGDHQRFSCVKQPVHLRQNVYAGGARPSRTEPDALVLEGMASVEVIEEGDAVYLQAVLPESFARSQVDVITGVDLDRVRIADADFEEPDGKPAVIDIDLVGERKQAGQTYPAGPLSTLAAGSSRVRIW